MWGFGILGSGTYKVYRVYVEPLETAAIKHTTVCARFLVGIEGLRRNV